MLPNRINLIRILIHRIIVVLGLFWLTIESMIELTDIKIIFTYWQFLVGSALSGFFVFLIDGFCFTGFFKQSIEIKSNAFDTKIVIKFDDIFQQDGWKAIAVNDFFDSTVDNSFVSSKSLHGSLLQKYWSGNIDDWDRQIETHLTHEEYIPETRSAGKQKRYRIGITAPAKKDGKKFLCVVLTLTDTSNQETKARLPDLDIAVRGLLCKARSICGNEPLSIPLMGSGLSRVGVKSDILVNLIVAAIFEETKTNKVTSEIRIVLPKEKFWEVNLVSIKNNWR